MASYDKRSADSWRNLWQFLGLAVVIHLALVPMLEPFLPTAEPFDGKPRKVRLVTLSGKTPPVKAKQRKMPQAEIERAKEKEKEKKEPEEINGQIVDIPPTASDEAPEDANFLSEHNTRAERETVSRHQQKDYLNAMNERTVARQQELASESPQRESQALEIGPERPEKDPGQKQEAGNERAFELPDIEKRDRLALTLDPNLGRLRNKTHSEGLKGNAKRLRLALGKDSAKEKQAGSAPKQAPTVAELVPAVGVLARLTGAPANDHLEDLDEGEGTFLNSREFKYATYFNRMKRGVSQHWHPMIEYMRRDPTGNIYGQRSRVTVLAVTLDPTGGVEKLEVSESSGLDFLDREALSAFRRAQPFPNPPKGLVGGEETFTFPFGFHVDFSRRGGLRLPF